MKSIIVRDLEVTPTTDELAECFANLDGEKQAHFLNLVGTYFKNFDGMGGLMQMENIVWWDNILTDDGRWFIEELAARVTEKDRGLVKSC